MLVLRCLLINDVVFQNFKDFVDKTFIACEIFQKINETLPSINTFATVLPLHYSIIEKSFC